MKKIVIGITGIPGSGKSTVARILQSELDAELIDMDELGRHITRSKTRILAEVFGKRILDEDGSLNTRKLGNLVFVDEPDGIPKLGKIVWNDLKSAVESAVSRATKKFVIIDGALLIELTLKDLCDFVLLVKTDPNVALNRFVARSGYPESAFFNILNHQLSQDEKEKQADFVVENCGGLDELKAKTMKILKKIRNAIQS